MTYEYKQYLAHHGIKGQKWGHRRFQNDDGSLTEEGRARYGVEDSKDFTREEYDKWVKELVADEDKKRANSARTRKTVGTVLAIAAGVGLAALAIKNRHSVSHFVGVKGKQALSNIGKKASDFVKQPARKAAADRAKKANEEAWRRHYELERKVADYHKSLDQKWARMERPRVTPPRSVSRPQLKYRR